MSVVLPEPLSPTRPKQSRAATSSETPSSAGYGRSAPGIADGDGGLIVAPTRMAARPMAGIAADLDRRRHDARAILDREVAARAEDAARQAG